LKYGIPKDTLNFFISQCESEYEKYLTENINYRNHIKSIWYKEDLINNQYKCKVLQLLSNKSLQTYLAVFTLIQNGFSDQAFMLFRNMFENYVISKFISENNERQILILRLKKE